MTRKLTQNEIEQLRRNAQRERRAQGLSHAQALDRQAARHGFANWSLLTRRAAQELPADLDEPVVRPGATVVRTALGLPRMDATREELKLIGAIVKRFETLVGGNSPESRVSLMMDLEACYSNGCPLDLVALLEAPRDEDLVHDVAGISSHLDRGTGQLQGFFSPRYARR